MRIYETGAGRLKVSSCAACPGRINTRTGPICNNSIHEEIIKAGGWLLQGITAYRNYLKNRNGGYQTTELQILTEKEN